MAVKTSRPIRSLSDVKTYAGRRPGEATAGYNVFFQIGALELERARRQRERDAALQRIAEIDRRLSEIDAETAALLASVGGSFDGRDAPRKGALRQGSPEADEADLIDGGEGERGLRLRY